VSSPAADANRPLVSAIPAGDSLEDYFDRLDAAFASLGSTTAAASGPAPGASSQAATGVTPRDADVDDAGAGIPTLDRVLGSGAREARQDPAPYNAPYRGSELAAPATVPAQPPAASPGNSSPATNGGRSLLAQAFNALLAVEQGEPGTGLIRLTKESPPPVVTEAMVEEVTRRVLLRLSPDSVRGVVGDIVSEIAERLVREEIQRIRNGG
jgi:hypothetical protein